MNDGGWPTVAIRTDVPGWLVLLITATFAVLLYWRRRYPLAALIASTVPAFANSLSGAVLQAEYLQLIVVYNIAYRLPFRSFWWVGALIAAPQTAGAMRFPDSAWWDRGAQFLWATLFVALMGVVVRSRRDYTRALVERARQLETERDQQARLAAAAERARIAREMHDIIGHNLSVITGLADGGTYASKKSPERARQALEGIATTSRQALGELRRLLDVLREDPPGEQEPDLSPQPALVDLDGLVERVRAAGLPVHTTVHGTPDAVPPGLQLTVYRLLQEALTNTMKHAGPGATAEIQVRYEPDEVRLAVTDRGGQPDSSAEPPHPLPMDSDEPRADAGRGLTGMRERTALYSGTLDAGPLTDGRGRPVGWRVHALLPLPEETTT
ncbi:sensor histidine kinase [Streptomyces uncialis]|uniref:sensor histidine kinase n=1 Tax=Streptomyces uncialis TaxID=1048205 RepID=UPI00386ED6E9|nr:histidine kinase [Streptomyces uncialis]